MKWSHHPSDSPAAGRLSDDDPARRSLVALLLLVACGSPAPVAPDAAAADGPPNFVLVDIDTLRADRLDAEYGGQPVMPNLQALAHRGVRFDQMFSQSGWTMPAVRSLLSGRYPTIAAQGPSAPATPPLQVSEILKIYGYHTAALWSEGFERRPGQPDTEFDWARIIRLKDVNLVNLDTQIDHFLAEAAQEPFMLLVHHFDAHVPGASMTLDHAHKWSEPLPGIACPMSDYDRTWRVLSEQLSAEKAKAHVQAHYDGVLSAYDTVLGHLMDGLDRSGLSSRTWVIVTSNHGEDFFSHQESVTHGALYDDLIRVPLVVVGPGVGEPDRAVDAMVQLVDIGPTLLDLAGIPIDQQMDGISLRPWLEQPAPQGVPADRTIMGITNRNNLSVRTRHYKLMQRTTGSDWQPGRPPKPGLDQGEATTTAPWIELYDLDADPSEHHDLYGEAPPVLASLTAALDAWRARAIQGGPATEMSPELKEQIQRQGYWGIVGEDQEGSEKPKP